MTNLEKLYSTISNLEELRLPVSPKLLLEADKLEEKIITEEILPLISEKIEPLLKEIQRDLVLVVEHHPNEPIKVALSRRMKISEIADAKPITPYASTPENPEPHRPARRIENPTKGLKVTFRDGCVVWHNQAVDTLIETLKIIGLKEANIACMKLEIKHAGYHLVSLTKRPPRNPNTWQRECDEWYIYTKTSNKQKCEDLQKISDYYNLGLMIEEVKPD